MAFRCVWKMAMAMDLPGHPALQPGWVRQARHVRGKGCFPSRALPRDALCTQAQWCGARLGSWGAMWRHIQLAQRYSLPFRRRHVTRW